MSEPVTAERSLLKELRKSLHLTQAQLGQRIGLSGSAITMIEKGTRGLTDQTRRSICREFNVSEDWLRSGEGEMFVQVPRNEALEAQIRSFLSAGTDSFRERLVSLLLRLDEEQWAALERYAIDLVGETPKAP